MDALPIPLNPFPKSVDSASLDDELFDILEDQVPIPQPEGPSEPHSLTRQVLRYAAAAA